MSSSNVMAVSSKIPLEVEVVAKATRRRFTAGYKLKVLREGLYSSHLAAWRKQRAHGAPLEKKRGPASKEKNPLSSKVAALEKETRRLRARAEALVELQKKVSEILGIELKHNKGKD